MALIGLSLAGWPLHSEGSHGRAGLPFGALVLIGVALAVTMIGEASPRVASVLILAGRWRTLALALAVALIA